MLNFSEESIPDKHLWCVHSDLNQYYILQEHDYHKTFIISMNLSVTVSRYSCFQKQYNYTVAFTLFKLPYQNLNDNMQYSLSLSLSLYIYMYTVFQKMSTFLLLEKLCQKLTDFNNFWYIKSWENLNEHLTQKFCTSH